MFKDLRKLSDSWKRYYVIAIRDIRSPKFYFKSIILIIIRKKNAFIQTSFPYFIITVIFISRNYIVFKFKI